MGERGPLSDRAIAESKLAREKMILDTVKEVAKDLSWIARAFAQASMSSPLMAGVTAVVGATLLRKGRLIDSGTQSLVDALAVTYFGVEGASSIIGSLTGIFGGRDHGFTVPNVIVINDQREAGINENVLPMAQKYLPEPA